VTLAATFNVPVVFLCENNGYAEFTKSDRWAGPRIVERAAAYGIDAEWVDGNDAVAVHEVMQRIVDGRRNGGGPLLLEAQTTRFTGHYEGDAQPYRSKSDLAALRELDPLRVLAGRLDAARAEEIEAEARAEMDEAVRLGLEAPYPDDNAVLEDIYA
jgi:2-oxoisovalerate dehydrogenase E1 component